MNERALDILADAGTRDGAEFEAYADAACAGNPALREEVRRLREAERMADRSMRGAIASEAALLTQSRKIGAYRVERTIGSGGMGTVYLASRADAEYDKRVAIKVVRASAASEEGLARFRHERQILAALEHPNIARLLDGGTTGDGEPYMVMEYVEGVSVVEHCRESRLDTSGVLRLFLQAANAIDFAHRHLIVHRDIKPSNILATPDGAIKLLDFGISKMLTGEESAWTQTPLLTPDYSSPEQKQGRAVTVATDVYSLGLVLREMLGAAGVPVAGDLERITGKALQSEPGRRYASVADFAADIQRYLDGRPVLARAATNWYKASMFLRRHRAGTAVAGLLILSVAGGWWSTAREARRTRLRFGQVRQMANAMLFDLHDSIRALPGSTPARAKLVETAQAYLATLEPDAAADRVLAAEVAAGYERLGDVQGGPGMANLGKAGAAAASYRRALTLREELAATGGSEGLRHLARVRVKTADSLVQAGQSGPALELLRQAVADASQASAANPGDIESAAALSDARHRLGDWLMRRGRAAEAIPHAESSLRAAQDLTAPRPGAERWRAEWQARLRLGEVYHQSGRLDDALEQYTRAGQLAGSAAQAGSRDVMIAEWLQGNVAGNPHYPNLGDEPRAEAHYRRALAMVEQRAARDPHDAGAKAELAVALGKLAVVLRERRPRESAIWFDRAIELRIAQKNAAPENVEMLRLLAYDLASSSRAWILAGNPAEAETRLNRALALDAEMVRRDPARVECCSDVPLYSMLLGDARWAAGKRAEAGDSYRKALEVSSHYGSRETCGIFCTRDWADSLARMSRWSNAMGQPEPARKYAEAAIDVWTKWSARNGSSAYIEKKLKELGSPRP